VWVRPHSTLSHRAGFTYQRYRGALFIEEVVGSPSNVAGLPVRLLLRLAREAGLDLGLPPQ